VADGVQPTGRPMANGDNSSSSVTNLNNHISSLAQAFASWTGHPATFLLAILVVVAWVAKATYNLNARG